MPSRLFGLVIIFALVLTSFSAAQTSSRVDLRDWDLQNGGRIAAKGDTISTAQFKPNGWLQTHVPSTVLGAQVNTGMFGDPFMGMNLRAIPGTSYELGKIFSRFPMPDDSPYRQPWWYRTEFSLPASFRGKPLALHFMGINYRANVWLNGKQIATADHVAGAYRTYEFPITDVAVLGGTNVLAVEVFAPTEKDLAINWVDWNPAPADKNMGLWREVFVTASGPVQVRWPNAVSKVDTNTLKYAELTVTADLRNATAQAVRGVLKGQIGSISFEQAVQLAPNESKTVAFAPDRYPQLRLQDPKLWWPYQMGEPAVHKLDVQFVVDGSVSDKASATFGIREVTSELTDKGHRLFKVNGKPILIRGGGWAPDMFLRSTNERIEQELKLTRHMGLNTIRLEGKMESDFFYDLADRMGLLLMPGWCCCDIWENWKDWTPETKKIAVESLRSEMLRMRNHPSMFVWLNGSDNPPATDVEQAYLDVLKELEWPNPVVSNATAKASSVSGPSGVKMTGPYDYVPPDYWLLDKDKLGGAYGYNTETGPGPAVPPVESLKKFIPKANWWPIDQAWNYHTGLGKFNQMNLFIAGLNARYGEAKSAEEFSLKSQAMTYDNQRAMFEAYSRNKYTSTGVVQWMLNNAWPSLIWHLYDYYLMPGGGYFGTKKATEPLHAMYSYDDRSIAVVNSTYQPAKGLKLTARVLNFDMTEKWSEEKSVDVDADGVVRPITVPDIEGLTTTYFVKLTLHDAAGRKVSDNFYWLSTRPVKLDWTKSTYYHTPVIQDADLTMLNTLPMVDLVTNTSTERKGNDTVVRVTVKNPSKSLAFMTRLRVAKGELGDDVLPIFWDDNYFSLLPGEVREITGTVATRDLANAAAVVKVEGWNVRPKTLGTPDRAKKN